jgi:hypothetical protein
MQIKFSFLNIVGRITPEKEHHTPEPASWASATQAETLGNQLWFSVQVYTEINTLANIMTWIDLPYNAVESGAKVLFVKPKIFYKWKPSNASGSVDWVSKKAIFDTPDNHRFFIHIESRLELLSFDTNCGWGSEAYWKRNLTEVRYKCLFCEPGTYQGARGQCHCVRNTFDGSFTGISKFICLG